MIAEKKGRYSAGILILMLGILSIAGSLIIAYWDFMGWFGFKKDDFISVLLEPRHNQTIGLGIGLNLASYLIGGIVFSIVGVGLIFSAMRVVPLIETVTVTLMCPYCKNRWEEPFAKTALESMGYPRVKSLSRRRCTKCGKFIRPRIVTVGGGAIKEAEKEVSETPPAKRRQKRKSKRKAAQANLPEERETEPS